MKKRLIDVLGIGLGLCLSCSLVLSACSSEEEQATTEEQALETFEESQPAATEPEPTETATAPPVEQPPVEQNQVFTSSSTKTSYVSAICLNVRSGASSQSPVVGHVFKGDQLSVYEQQGGWARITDAAGYVSGWVSTSYLSDSFVKSDFVIPEDYKAPRTPTVIQGISAKYVGTAACKGCHIKPHAGFPMGPYGVWQDHFHSDAYHTLDRQYSRALAAKRGVSDPLSDWRCLKCHVTAYGVAAERLGPNYRDDEGVGCEACHGPGSEYLMPHANGSADEATLAAMGFRIYRSLEDRDKMCRACHNELSPTYKPFNVEAFSEAIRHWEKEYQIVVTSPQAQPVISEKKPPAPKPAAPPPKQEEQIAKVVAPPPAPPPPAQTKPSASQPASKPASKPVDPRLAGIANDWMLDKNGPQRGPVFFPHVKHITDYVMKEGETEVCQVCHHKTEAGATPGNCSNGPCHKFEVSTVASREKAFHGNCRTCHREENAGPQKCSECHNN